MLATDAVLARDASARKPDEMMISKSDAGPALRLSAVANAKAEGPAYGPADATSSGASTS